MRHKHYLLIVLSCIMFFTCRAQVIYNAYARVTSVTSGSVLAVDNVNQTNHTFNVNDLVIVMQMQDNVIGTNTTNAATFGDLSSIQNTGRFEVARILSRNPASGTPTSITLASSLANTYNTGANSSVQIISFRRLSAAAFTTTNSITGLSWNGFVGGVIAIETGTTLTLAHNITADGIGFRGGVKNTPNGYTACENTTYVTAVATRYAGKGEGIYKNTNTAYGGARGKILTGGGGGNDVNAGGGGGGNFSSGGVAGSGWVPAGTGCSPGVGGLGGITLSSYTGPSRVYMGGGGGGGHENDGVGTVGGNGGGIILIKTGTLVTTSACAVSISANGGTAGNGVNDGAGGGGAGGSIVMQVNSYSVAGTCPLTVRANGGGGGSSVTTGVHGAGAGGGQGVIIYSYAQPTVNVTSNTLPGTGGTSCAGCPTANNGAPGTGPNNSGVLTNSVGVLPLELISFNATDAGEHVALTWVTASEKNTHYFLIERSVNGLQWETIARVNAAGNSSSVLSYETNDMQPLQGLSYYRLKTIDLDLSYQYSNLEVIERRKKEDFIIYPNPSTSIFNIRFLSYGNEPAELKIYDALGKLVYDKTFQITTDQTEFELNHNLAEGIYTVKVLVNSSSSNCKLTVIR